MYYHVYSESSRIRYIVAIVAEEWPSRKRQRNSLIRMDILISGERCVFWMCRKREDYKAKSAVGR